MAIYRTVQMTFWTDGKVIENFTPEERYFYLYLLTNPHTNLCGCYEIVYGQMSIETGYTREIIDRLMNRLEQTHKVIEYSKKTREVLLLNWSKFNWTRSEDFIKPLTKEIERIKDDGFREFLTEKKDGVKRVMIPSKHPPKTTVTDTDSVPDSDADADSDKDAKAKVDTSKIISEITDLYQQICVSYPRIKSMSEARKTAIKARLKQYTVDDFRTLFEKAEASDFLKGANKNNWSATFDWLIKDTNMAKVLDGNYDNRQGASQGREMSNGDRLNKFMLDYINGQED